MSFKNLFKKKYANSLLYLKIFTKKITKKVHTHIIHKHTNTRTYTKWSKQPERMKNELWNKMISSNQKTRRRKRNKTRQDKWTIQLESISNGIIATKQNSQVSKRKSMCFFYRFFKRWKTTTATNKQSFILNSWNQQTTKTRVNQKKWSNF